MRAVWYDRQGPAGEVLTYGELPTPSPGPGEVLVKVACGICLSDVHLLDGTLPGPLPVVTPGHEAAGRPRPHDSSPTDRPECCRTRPRDEARLLFTGSPNPR